MQLSAYFCTIIGITNSQNANQAFTLPLILELGESPFFSQQTFNIFFLIIFSAFCCSVLPSSFLCMVCLSCICLEHLNFNHHRGYVFFLYVFCFSTPSSHLFCFSLPFEPCRTSGVLGCISVFVYLMTVSTSIHEGDVFSIRFL